MMWCGTLHVHAPKRGQRPKHGPRPEAWPLARMRACSPTASARARDTNRRKACAAYVALGPTRGPRPDALCRKMQRTASATAGLLHRPRLLASVMPENATAQRGFEASVMSEKCNVGNSRTVAPAAVYGVDCDTALGPTRYAGKCNAHGPRPDALCWTMQRTASATADPLHPPCPLATLTSQPRSR